MLAFLPIFLSFQLVDINKASLEQLKTIEGVGQKMAERIVEHRDENGGFASLEDLMMVQGMKPKLFDKVSKQITLNSPKTHKSKSSAPQIMSDAEVADLVNAYDSEPTVGQLQEQALKYANAHPEQIRNWLERARKAYWLPKFTTGMDPHLMRQDILTDKTDTSRNGTDWKFHLRAEWHFNNLIFNHEEVGVGREFLRQSLMRERILDRINEAYFERRRLQIGSKTGAASTSQAKIENAIKLQELTAELDGLTGGWFSKQL